MRRLLFTHLPQLIDLNAIEKNTLLLFILDLKHFFLQLFNLITSFTHSFTHFRSSDQRLSPKLEFRDWFE
jgi:hypothetical protein